MYRSEAAMDTNKLKKFAQFARRTLREQVAAKLALVLSNGSAARRESAGRRPPGLDGRGLDARDPGDDQPPIGRPFSPA